MTKVKVGVKSLGLMHYRSHLGRRRDAAVYLSLNRIKSVRNTINFHQGRSDSNESRARARWIKASEQYIWRLLSAANAIEIQHTVTEISPMGLDRSAADAVASLC